jgi:hypothetical protein
LRVVPELTQVSKYGSECPQRRFTWSVSQTPRAGFHVAMSFGTEESSHVLCHHVARAEFADRVDHVIPQTRPSLRVKAGALAGHAHVLAREPATQDVDRLDLVPVDLGDVAVIRDGRPVVGEDLRRGVVDLAEPGRLGAEHFGYRHVQAAIACEQSAALHPVSPR